MISHGGQWSMKRTTKVISWFTNCLCARVLVSSGAQIERDDKQDEVEAEQDEASHESAQNKMKRLMNLHHITGWSVS